MKIVIDPGHGGSDRANRGANGYVEADGVVDIGLRLRILLQKAGYQVYMTREGDQTVSLAERSAIANDLQADLFISIHTNAAADTAAGGIETFHSFKGEWGTQYQAKAKAVAQLVQEKLVQKTGFRNRGIKTRLIENFNSPYYGQDYYSVIRRTKMPSLIIEAGFHTNVAEERMLQTPEMRQVLAEGIFEGIEAAYPLSADPVQTPELMEKNIEVTIHGKEQEVEGIFYQNSHYVPIRFLEQFGYQIEWDEGSGQIHIRYRN